MSGRCLQTNTMSKLHLSIGLCLLLGLMAYAPSAWSQQGKHAPTVEQCRDDQGLWLPKLENDSASISYDELMSLGQEMHECQKIDPEFADRYCNTDGVIEAVKELRFYSFLHRHTLLHQFLTEDAEGKR